MSDAITAQELRFERTLDAPVERVWQFLADPELRRRWFMADAAGTDDLRVGGTIGFAFSHAAISDGDVPTPAKYRAFEGNRWAERVTRYEPPHLLAFEWENGAAGEVVITLTAHGERTRLLLVHSGLRGRDDAANFGGGWGSHLAALERRVRGDGVADFWTLHAAAERAVERALG